MRARSHRAGGFTLLEIMVSLVVLVLGLLGVMALQMTTVKGNRQSRELDRAVDLVAQVMEDLRGIKTCKLVVTCGTTCDPPTAGNSCPVYPDITTSDGVTYQRSYSAVPIAGQATLVLVTATVTYADDQDNTITHTQAMQMIRTTVESL